MARRDRAPRARRLPHPGWAWCRQTLPRLAAHLGVLAAIGLALVVWTMVFIQRSPYFWVSSVEVEVEPGQRWIADPRIGYRLRPPSHLLRVQLPGLAAALQREHPQLARVVVRRQLPNRLVAHVALREPVAQLRGRQYYLISAGGIVLAQGRPSPWRELPVVALGPPTAAYTAGQSCAGPELRQAVAALEQVGRARGLAGHRVTMVRVMPAAPGMPSGRMVSLLLDTGLELRAGDGELGTSLARVGELLRTRGREMAQAQYVDLRFDDLVVGMRGDEAR